MIKTSDIKPGTIWAVDGYAETSSYRYYDVHGVRKVIIKGPSDGAWAEPYYSGYLHNGTPVDVPLVNIVMSWAEWKAGLNAKARRLALQRNLHAMLGGDKCTKRPETTPVFLTADELEEIVGALSHTLAQVDVDRPEAMFDAATRHDRR